MEVAGTLAGLQSHGTILVDGSDAGVDDSGDNEIITMPATRLAMEHIGRPVPNTALLAAFITLTGLMPLAALIDALAERFKGPVLEKNQKLVEAAAGTVEAGRWREVAHGVGA